MLAEAAKYGSVEIRRVYGDWASGKLSSWRPTVQQHALVPVQQFTAVSGKNATDSALIIDAMDILHGGRISGFCIVSSDSDFTRLATRLRESGMFVVGIGRAQTPPAFRNACNVFVATENLIGSREEVQQPAKAKKPPSVAAQSSPTPVKPPAIGGQRPKRSNLSTRRSTRWWGRMGTATLLSSETPCSSSIRPSILEPLGKQTGRSSRGNPGEVRTSASAAEDLRGGTGEEAALREVVGCEARRPTGRARTGPGQEMESRPRREMGPSWRCFADSPARSYGRLA